MQINRSNNPGFTLDDSEIRFFGSIFLLLVILLIISFAMGSKVERGGTSVPGETASHVFPAVEVEAKAAYVYDARTKEVLFAKNENERLALASVTKLMTALVASEILPEYSTVVITSEALGAEGDSGLRRDEKWSLKDLLDFSLVTSSNDGMKAVALALGALHDSQASSSEAVDGFVQKMNEKASSLDLKNTYYFNSTGLDESAVKGGAYGTVSDIARLFEYILTYKSDLLVATRDLESSFVSENGIAHEAKNTNTIVDEIPGLLASKTGFTDIGGGNLVIAFDPELGRPIIVVVLGSSEDGRFKDVQKLVDASMTYITGEPLEIEN